ncbi:hypothetical protein U1Q18_031179 [Sarracenia purpurea var. burkii]
MELCNTFVTIRQHPPTLRVSVAHRRIKSFISLATQSLSAITSYSVHRLRLAVTLQNEALETLKWPSVCKQVSDFTSISMGFVSSESGHLTLGRSLGESWKPLDQTTVTLALPQPLDFAGIEYVSEIVKVSVLGELLMISEFCSVKRTLRSAKELFKQLEKISLHDDDSS